MAVFQLVEHVGADDEEFLACHFRAYPAGVCVMDGIPVNAFFVKEAVVFVDDGPERFEVALRIVGILLDAVTRG